MSTSRHLASDYELQPAVSVVFDVIFDGLFVLRRAFLRYTPEQCQ